LVAFRVRVTVTPMGMLIVVKFKTPLGGKASALLAVGLNAPSAPVLPLEKVWASPKPGVASRRPAAKRPPRIHAARLYIACLLPVSALRIGPEPTSI
jgi:hypothetical protein